MEFLRQYKILYKKANTDLKVAKILLEGFENGGDELDLEVIMFHLQQASEKLFKSILAYNKRHISKTHDIHGLILACRQSDVSLIDGVDMLVALTEYATEGRYAIIHDDLHDVDKYIAVLDELLIFVQKEIA